MNRQRTGRLIDLDSRTIRGVRLTVSDGSIDAIEPCDEVDDVYLCRGFVDAHVHIESSLLTPSRFAAEAVRHGTVATVSDPHEIANVCGVEGVDYMLADAARVPLKVHFGAPSCVPATTFETAGATLSPDDVASLLARDRIGYLSEMMNWPGVLNDDPDVTRKIAAARDAGKPVDGHAPGLRGDDARRYFAAGITADHECFAIEEALDKLRCDALIQIREGSAARNYDALHPLITSHPGRVCFCSDDKHADDLMEGHIDRLCARAVADGHDVFDVLDAACRVAVDHYDLPVGRLRVGDPADFVVLRDLTNFDVLETWIDGRRVDTDAAIAGAAPDPINRFAAEPVEPAALNVAVPGDARSVRVIVATDGLITTGSEDVAPVPVDAGRLVTDVDRDLLKIVVHNRYRPSPPAVAMIRGFGLRRGAIASSVAHDSHNIVAVGADDDSIAAAINRVVEHRGGLSCVEASGDIAPPLPLPIAGLMADRPAAEVGRAYQALDAAAKSLGSDLRAPYMTLSFMALLVIPSLKLSDRGLFDGERFEFVEMFKT